MISAPSVFGKVPAKGDFVRHNAPLVQVDVWRRWFDAAADAAAPRPPTLLPAEKGRHWFHLEPPGIDSVCRLREAEPCHFILRPQAVGIPGDGYLIGVIAGSWDRVGRRYPLVVWQMADDRWAGRMLAAPASWPTDLARLVHDHIRLPGRTDLVAGIQALWDGHRPDWRDRVSVMCQRIADRRHRGAEGAPWDGGPGMASAVLRADWPPLRFGGAGLGSFWQADTPVAVEIDGALALQRLIAKL